MASLAPGGGSNTLSDDTGYPGPVIRMATRGIAVRPCATSYVSRSAGAQASGIRTGVPVSVSGARDGEWGRTGQAA
ncbi:hypothetical protein [Streptomyces sp. NPDC051636]|uniref:hypothetical protein n=1 Tax=Streptomyces sp. NPDC051636 TaxID=3365663 RepID=UPI003792FB28